MVKPTTEGWPLPIATLIAPSLWAKVATPIFCASSLNNWSRASSRSVGLPARPGRRLDHLLVQVGNTAARALISPVAP